MVTPERSTERALSSHTQVNPCFTSGVVVWYRQELQILQEFLHQYRDVEPGRHDDVQHLARALDFASPFQDLPL